MSEQDPESDYTNLSVPDESLPEDMQPGEDNPLAEPASGDGDRQDMGDPHIPGLERDPDDRLSLPEEDEGED